MFKQLPLVVCLCIIMIIVYNNANYPQVSGTLSKDAPVFEATPDLNFGSSPLLSIQNLSYNGLSYSAIYFNLPTLPEGATITDAELKLYCFDRTGSSVGFKVGYYSDQSWASQQ